ncbi:hypothetical protein AX16_007861 [Volvariella volvacea WC 439]|nr:hypothetical protein AX16_007861 [Volvariella volvacea WC 439]
MATTYAPFRPACVYANGRERTRRRGSQGQPQRPKSSGRRSESADTVPLSSVPTSVPQVTLLSNIVAESDPPSNPLSAPEPYNVLIFGQTGTGKSSLVNMIAGQDIAETSSSALGCTFGSRPYDISLSVNTRPIRLWDTAGLNESAHGTMSAEEAIDSLKQLIAELHGQVHLLVYCITGGRLKEIALVNYDLFYRVVCQKKVPIVLVVTGLELEEDMESWWVANREELEGRGMRFVSHACITTTKGKEVRGEYQFEEEYNESQILVRNVLLHTLATFPAGGAVNYKVVWKNVSDAVSAWLAGLKPEGYRGQGSGAQRSSWVSRYAARLGMTIHQAWELILGGKDRTQPVRHYR